jgi:serine/threonine protein kinase
MITEYYESGDLTRYITNDFFNISWRNRLKILHDIASGIESIHKANIVHKDFHSGNIFINNNSEARTGDLGLSKSSLDNADDDEIYGIIPYVAPEILQGQKYTKASDIYSFGMIMWELMTGRRPFWDQSHNSDLIIEICDGLRPPIVTNNVPEGYIELMKECWHSDPDERPTASSLVWNNFGYSDSKLNYKHEENNPTKIVESSDIGPVTANNPDAIYKSRSLSAMIKSAESTRSLKSQSIILKFGRRFILYIHLIVPAQLFNFYHII